MSGEASSLQRLALVLEFDGMAFHGWQRQETGASVQASLEDALAAVDGRAMRTVAAGRTDAGVHGEALLVHADVDKARWRRSPSRCWRSRWSGWSGWREVVGRDTGDGHRARRSAAARPPFQAGASK